jgi:hypothetical protein
LPDKHTTVFPLRRYGFIAGAATLLIVLVSWVAVRAAGPAAPDRRVPLMVQPTMPLGAAAPSVIPWGRGNAAPPPSAAPPVPTRTTTTPAHRTTTTPVSTRKPTAKATTKKPTPTRATSSPAPATTLTARYSTGPTWDRGFIGAVAVTNTGSTARTWTVQVTYEASAGVRLGNTWNAQVSKQGDTFVLTGGPLAPGATVNLGYEASKQVRSPVQPSGCTVAGTSCRMS